MKIVTSIFLIFISLSLYGQDYYYINAQSGLNVRLDGDLGANRVAKIPFGGVVEKISDTDKTICINDNGKQIIGKFVKIRYNNYVYLVDKETRKFEREGYVFDGYLKKLTHKDLVTTIKINKSKYIELLKKATKTIYKPKKISNLDAVKAVLIDRVEWFTDSDELNTIMSITTDNGQKLILDINAVDFGFAEGYSGYYPEYDILFLEGGHSSDVCFSIKTGETEATIGNPAYIIPSPKNTYRLNGYFGGQECITYFFQKKENGKFTYLTKFNGDGDLCTFKEFYWIGETQFIYSKMNYSTNSENGEEAYFKGDM